MIQPAPIAFPARVRISDLVEITRLFSDISSTEITLDHLLLGLFSNEEALPAELLNKQNISINAVTRAAYVAANSLPSCIGDLRVALFNGPILKVFELTLQKVLRLGHNYIGAEHVLLVLLELEEGPLHGSGIDKERFEADLIAALQSSEARPLCNCPPCVAQLVHPRSADETAAPYSGVVAQPTSATYPGSRDELTNVIRRVCIDDLLALAEAFWDPGSTEITLDHLVLGVLEKSFESVVELMREQNLDIEEGPTQLATVLLHKQNIDTEAIRAAAATSVATIPACWGERKPALFTGPVCKVFERTLQQALRLGHNYIGAEHMLLALLELEEGPLHGSDIDKERFEADLIATLQSPIPCSCTCCTS